MLMDRLSAGEFGILFAAPPCRTFSVARARPNGPPVLRDRQAPEGLSLQDYKLAGINDAEASKVLCDNMLSQRTADACQIMANLSRPFAVEQPWPWKEDTAIVILPVADNTPDASGPITPDVHVVESDEDEEVPRDGLCHISLKEMQTEIDNMFVTSQERYNKTCRPEDRFNNGISEMLGLNVRAEVSRATKLNGNLFSMIMQWFRAQPGCEYFPVTSVQVNKNLLCQPHRDRANEGPSMIVVFGQFLGGAVLLWPNDDGRRPVNVIVEQGEPEQHLAATPMQFDGRLVHGTDSFIGVRYSLVFFSVLGAAAASRQTQSQLVREGALCDAWQVQAA